MTVQVVEGMRHVGAVDSFELNRFSVFDLDGKSIGVVKTPTGFYAVLNRCPHQGANICAGRVSGTMEASDPQEFSFSSETMVAVCPWHRWEFELETGNSYGQVTDRKLMIFDVEVADGQVYVSTARKARKP